MVFTEYMKIRMWGDSKVLVLSEEFKMFGWNRGDNVKITVPDNEKKIIIEKA